MKNGRAKKVSRRKFLFEGGAAAAAALVATVTDSFAASKKKPANPAKEKQSDTVPAAVAPQDAPPVTLQTVDLTITVNGKKKSLSVPAGRTLAEVLRDDFGLTGVKIGCGSAECGACTVLINSRPFYSCMTLAALADQSVIETVEGISASASSGGIHPIQKAFIEKDAMQCGYCTPGMVCASKALLIQTPRPTVEQIREGLSGNLCRCGTYEKIVQALRSVAES